MAGPRGGGGVSTARPDKATWTPTVANLIVLVALEIAGYCALRWAFRTAHGG